ncbi:MAG TPA: hypothetical protein VND21_07720, partial [Planctomycetota bacterium]|nr:hypothetical protein [Planctomycetota bacterium]
MDRFPAIAPRTRTLTGVAILASLAVAAGFARGAPPEPPPPPAQGFGAPTSATVAVESGSFPNPIDADLLVHWLRPAGRKPNERLPLVAFLHGFGAPSERPYRAWLEHLARRGAIVVYPVYPSVEARSARTRYDAMWAGLEAAVDAVPATGARPDPSRLGVIGHSFGGGAAPAIAARAAARGWGRDGLWILALAPWYDLDRAAWASLPPHAHLLAVAYEDDKVCDPGIAGTFPALATTIPADRKAFRCLRSDPHGSPELRAEHGTPLTFRGVDAYDTRGTWQVADALAAAAGGDEAARRVALGRSAEELDLGRWSDGTPVRTPLASWPPDAGEPSRPRRQWRPGGQQAAHDLLLLA